jgi:hypothetical protein
MSTNIPNLIKQPSQCCVYCGKSYKKKINLEKHVNLCELLNKSKKSFVVEDIEELPSQMKLYQILLELGNKFNKLEEKVDELNKWVNKKKKKINLIDWLNLNKTPEIKFEHITEKIIISEDDVKYLFENSFVDTLNRVFSKNIYNSNDNPIFAFVIKTNVFYIYENDNTKWIELTRETLIKFLNKVHMKLFRVFVEYKKINSDKIKEDEKFALLCDKTSLKLVKIEFTQEFVINKIISTMFSKLKKEVDPLINVEYENDDNLF